MSLLLLVYSLIPLTDDNIHPFISTQMTIELIRFKLHDWSSHKYPWLGAHNLLRHNLNFFTLYSFKLTRLTFSEYSEYIEHVHKLK